MRHTNRIVPAKAGYAVYIVNIMGKWPSYKVIFSVQRTDNTFIKRNSDAIRTPIMVIKPWSEPGDCFDINTVFLGMVTVNGDPL